MGTHESQVAVRLQLNLGVICDDSSRRPRDLNLDLGCGPQDSYSDLGLRSRDFSSSLRIGLSVQQPYWFLAEASCFVSFNLGRVGVSNVHTVVRKDGLMPFKHQRPTGGFKPFCGLPILVPRLKPQ